MRPRRAGRRPSRDLLAVGRGYRVVSQSKSFQIFSLNSAAVILPCAAVLGDRACSTAADRRELHALDADLIGELKRTDRQLAEVLRDLP